MYGLIVLCFRIELLAAILIGILRHPPLALPWFQLVIFATFYGLA